MNSSKKIIRQENLSKMLERNPFLTDEQLAKALEVSIQTIRLDRLRMNIPEVRERTRQMAETAQTKLKAIDKKDIVGDLIDLELNRIGISMLKITPEMVLEKTGVARGYYMFAMANTLALAVVDADAALTGVGGGSYSPKGRHPLLSGLYRVGRCTGARLRCLPISRFFSMERPNCLLVS